MSADGNLHKAVVGRIRAVRLRILMLDALGRVLWCIFFALALVWLALIADRLFFMRLPLASLGAKFLAAAMLLGVLQALVRFPSLTHAAIVADENLLLKERLSTALSILSGRQVPADVGESSAAGAGTLQAETASAEMENAVLADAAEQAKRTSLADAVQLQFPRVLKLLPVPLVLLIATFFFMPQFDLLGSGEQEKTEKQRIAAMRKKIEPVEKTKKRMEEIGKLRELKEAQKVAKELEKLMEAMEQKAPEKKEVLAKISSLEDQLQERAKNLQDEKDKARDLKKALAPKGEEDSKEKGELEKNLAEGNFEKAAEQLEQLKSDLASGKLSAEDMKKLQQELSKLAGKLADEKSLQELAKKLSEAQSALSQNDMQRLMDKLGQMSNELKDLENSLSDADALQLAMDELDNLKDALAEAGEDGNCPTCGSKLSEMKGKPCPGKDGKEG